MLEMDWGCDRFPETNQALSDSLMETSCNNGMKISPMEARIKSLENAIWILHQIVFMNFAKLSPVTAYLISTQILSNRY